MRSPVRRLDERLRRALAALIEADQAVLRAQATAPTLAEGRAAFHAGLVPATLSLVAVAFGDPDPEGTARAREEEVARRAAAERDRLRRERITYTIDLTKEQWRLLVKHGHDPTLPPNGTRRPEPHVVVEPAAAARLGAWGPLRSGVCELEGIEIDGHEASDLDPFGGCMWCGKQEIYGTGDDGRPLRYDEEATR